MSVEQNKNVVRRTMAELDARNLDGVIATYAADAVFHGFAPEPLDINGYRAMMSALLTAFPDSHFPVHEILAEGDHVVCRHSMQGTHGNDFQGIPATGRPVVVNAIALFRLDEGKVAEIWLNADFLGLMQQIGAIPAAA